MTVHDASTQDHEKYLQERLEQRSENADREELRRRINYLGEMMRKKDQLIDLQKQVLDAQSKYMTRIQCEAKKILTGEQTPTGFLTFLGQKPDIEL